MDGRLGNRATQLHYSDQQNTYDIYSVRKVSKYFCIIIFYNSALGLSKYGFNLIQAHTTFCDIIQGYFFISVVALNSLNKLYNIDFYNH